MVRTPLSVRLFTALGERIPVVGRGGRRHPSSDLLNGATKEGEMPLWNHCHGFCSIMCSLSHTVDAVVFRLVVRGHWQG